MNEGEKLGKLVTPPRKYSEKTTELINQGASSVFVERTQTTTPWHRDMSTLPEFLRNPTENSAAALAERSGLKSSLEASSTPSSEASKPNTQSSNEGS